MGVIISPDDEKLKISKNSFREILSVQNVVEWQKVLKKISPTGIPDSYTWVGVEAMLPILKRLGQRFLSFAYRPRQGLLEFDGADLADEAGCLQLYDEDKEAAYLLKPESLEFEFMNGRIEWSDFRLECDRLEPTGHYEMSDEWGEWAWSRC